MFGIWIGFLDSLWVQICKFSTARLHRNQQCSPLLSLVSCQLDGLKKFGDLFQHCELHSWLHVSYVQDPLFEQSVGWCNRATQGIFKVVQASASRLAVYMSNLAR